jgi:hypothetical protein
LRQELMNPAFFKSFIVDGVSACEASGLKIMYSEEYLTYQR